MRVVLANVRGVSDVKNRSTVIKKALQYKADICCLTETKGRDEDLFQFRKKFKQNGPKKSVFMDNNEEGHRKSGVLIAFKPGILDEMFAIKESGVGRYLILACKVSGMNYIICCYYGNSEMADRPSHETMNNFSKDLLSMSAQFPFKNIVMGGDWNCIINSNDAMSRNPKKQTEQCLIELLEHHGMVDLWSQVRGDEAGYTFDTNLRNDGGEVIGVNASRLDRLYCTPEMLHLPEIDRKPPLRGSADHLSLVADLVTAPRDPPGWKFPDYLLKNDNYLEVLHNVVREFLVTNSTDAETYYDTEVERPPDPANRVWLEPPVFENESRPDRFPDINMTLAYTSSLSAQFMDRSTALKKAKLKAFYAKLRKEPADPPPETIDKLCNNLKYTASAGSVLYSLLGEVVNKTKEYQKSRKSGLKQEIVNLHNRLLKLQLKNHEFFDKYRQREILIIRETISQLQNRLYIRNKRGAMAFCGAHNERSNAAFLRTHKKGTATQIHKIVEKRNGVEIEHRGDQATIFMQDKFKQLFSSPSEVDNGSTIEGFLGEDIRHLKKLPRHIFEMLDARPTMNELDTQIAKPHEGTAPGPSGITYALIKHIWPVIKNIFLEHTLEVTGPSGVLEALEKLRKMILIGKPDKERTSQDGYRPISLLEVTYKIISGLFADRLKLAIPHIIGTAQKGFTKNRSTQDAVRAIIDIRNLAIQEGRPGVFMSCDLSKAFDTISHAYLFQAMKLMGFPDSFIRVIKTLISNPRVAFHINGRVSESFVQRDGTGQGDPVSSFLFLIAIEVLLIKLTYSDQVHRFAISQERDIEFEPEGFADDVILFLNATKPRVLQKVLNILTDFGKLSGLHLSKPKTQIMMVGSARDTAITAGVLKLQLVNRIRYLGVYVYSKDNPGEHDSNFDMVFDKMKSILASRAWMHHSPIGTALICKSLMATVGVHVLHNFIPTPKWIVKANKLMREMVWSGGRAQIRQTRVTAPVALGGLDLVEISLLKTALKVFWFRKITNLPKVDGLMCNWARILDLNLRKLDLTIRMLPRLGYLDLRWVAKKFKHMGLAFWSSTIHSFARAAQLAEEATPYWQSWNIFGGKFQNLIKTYGKRGGEWLTVRNDLPYHDTEPIRNMVAKGIFTLSHIHDLIDSYVIRFHFFTNTACFIDVNGLDRNDTFQIKVVYKEIQRGLKFHAEILRTIPMGGNGKYCDYAPLQFKTMSVRQGCSFFTKWLKKERVKNNKWDSALAWLTWRTTHGLTLTQSEWGAALNLVYRTKLPIRMNWNSFSIFIRTCWTNKKKFLKTKNEEDSYCTLCMDYMQDTKHLYYSCPITKKLYNNLKLFLGQEMQLSLVVSINTMMFHTFSNKEFIDKQRLTALISAAKYTIWKLNSGDTDPDLPPEIIWLKFVTNAVWVADTKLVMNQDTDFWGRLRNAIRDWTVPTGVRYQIQLSALIRGQT